MEIILKADIKGLGYKYDVIKVKDGYGRNFLIPQGLAVVANNPNRKERDENVRQAAFKQDKIKNDAVSMADKLKDLTLKVGAKVGENGRIFGAVTTLQVADVLKDKGFDIDRRKIALKGEIKTIGTYIAEIDLHRDVKVDVNVEVVGE